MVTDFSLVSSASVMYIQPSATVEEPLMPFETPVLFGTPSPTPQPVSTPAAVLPTPPTDMSSGSGDLVSVLCDNADTQLQVSQYDFIIGQFEELGCHSSELDDSVVYLITTSEGREVVNAADTFSDYFTLGTYMPSITVCSSGEPIVCNDTALQFVHLEVRPTEDRLFPFGSNFGDSYIANVDDRAVSISIPRGIPFLTRYYATLYVS